MVELWFFGEGMEGGRRGGGFLGLSWIGLGIFCFAFVSQVANYRFDGFINEIFFFI